MHPILWDVCAFTLPPFSESLAEIKRTKLKNPIKCYSSEASSVLLRVRICSDMLIDRQLASMASISYFPLFLMFP